MDRLSLGKRIKMEREKRGWTQEYLANLLNIKIGTLSGYERGYRQPDIQMLQKIADAFNVSTDYLLGRDSQKDQRQKLLELPLAAHYESQSPIDDDEELLEIIERMLERRRQKRALTTNGVL